MTPHAPKSDQRQGQSIAEHDALLLNGNVVKRFFSTPQNKIEKRRKFKPYFVCKMALKPTKVEY